MEAFSTRCSRIVMPYFDVHAEGYKPKPKPSRSNVSFEVMFME